MSDNSHIRIAYLVSQYPAASHTFILREILELRRLGFELHVASIRPPDRPFAQLTADEQQEQRTTFYVKPKGAAGILATNIAVFFKRPSSYLSAFLYSLRLAGLNARAALFNLAYLAEAAVVTDWMGRRHLSHLHMHFTSTVGLLAMRLAPLRVSATIHGSAEFLDPRGFYLEAEDPRLPLVVHHQRLWTQPINALLGPISMAQVPRRPSGRRSNALFAADVS